MLNLEVHFSFYYIILVLLMFQEVKLLFESVEISKETVTQVRLCDGSELQMLLMSNLTTRKLTSASLTSICV